MRFEKRKRRKKFNERKANSVREGVVSLRKRNIYGGGTLVSVYVIEVVGLAETDSQPEKW